MSDDITPEKTKRLERTVARLIKDYKRQNGGELPQIVTVFMSEDEKVAIDFMLMKDGEGRFFYESTRPHRLRFPAS